MRIELRNPTIADFIDQQVKSGAFADATDVVEAFLGAAMLNDGADLDQATVAAINEGIAQAERGELRDWSDVRTELVRKYQID